MSVQEIIDVLKAEEVSADFGVALKQIADDNKVAMDSPIILLAHLLKRYNLINGVEAKKELVLIPLPAWDTMGHIPHVPLAQRIRQALEVGLGSYVVVAKKTHFMLSSLFLRLLTTTAAHRTTHVASKDLFAGKRRCFLWTFGSFTDTEADIIEAIVADSVSAASSFCDNVDARTIEKTYKLMVEFAAVCSFTLSATLSKTTTLQEAVEMAKEVRALFDPVQWDPVCRASAERFENLFQASKLSRPSPSSVSTP